MPNGLTNTKKMMVPINKGKILDFDTIIHAIAITIGITIVKNVDNPNN